jgi:histidinol-phosphate aminotransferase
MSNSNSTSFDRIQPLFPKSLMNMNPRKFIKATGNEVISLDKNELPYEIDEHAKEIIIEKLKKTSWNRYPSAYYPILERKIAHYSGVNRENIVIGTGAAPLIEMLFNLFSRKNLIIAHPSFSLFEFLCKAYGINYQTWKLDQSLQYNHAFFPELNTGSVIVLASPNNPTGTVIKAELLSSLLNLYPDSLFIVDEVYSEFCNKTLEGLINEYSNLILVRSFSKALGLAGARIGYLVSSEPITKQLKKIVLPFVLNHFSEIVLETILSTENILQDIKSKINRVVEDRDYMVNRINEKGIQSGIVSYQSEANFILVKFTDEQYYKKSCEALEKENINILRLSHISALKQTMRISIGTPEENEKVLKCLLNC